MDKVSIDLLELLSKLIKEQERLELEKLLKILNERPNSLREESE